VQTMHRTEVRELIMIMVMSFELLLWFMIDGLHCRAVMKGVSQHELRRENAKTCTNSFHNTYSKRSNLAPKIILIPFVKTIKRSIFAPKIVVIPTIRTFFLQCGVSPTHCTSNEGSHRWIDFEFIFPTIVA
jgi:hypothetical protein